MIRLLTRLAGLLVCLAAVWPSGARALEVFACQPEWAALATELGGATVNVVSATTARQDSHQIQARPSLIARVRAADLVICTGAELEAGWLPLLLRQAANPKIQAGSPGYFEASQQVRLRDVPAQLDRAMGDIHASGNPHIQTDPRNIAVVAAALARRLQQIDPGNAATIAGRAQHFAARWDTAIQRWTRQAAPLRGTAIAVYHKNWTYLQDWLGLREAGTIEPKPGIPPGSQHLAQLVAELPALGVRGVVYAAYEDARASEFVARHIGVPAILLPFTVGGTDRATDLFGLFDDTVDRLLHGLAEAPLGSVELAILLPAFVAGLLVLSTHVPLGQLVLERGIVFIDLAIAQAAGLGVVAADAMGLEPHGWPVQLAAGSAALLSAAFLLWSERRLGALQEAVIGAVFVVAASAELIVLGFHPHGAEHLKNLLVGQILWVEPRQLVPVAVLYTAVLAAFLIFDLRRNRPLFYVLFAVTITASVQLVGVFLVFASLILPALAATSVAPRWRPVFGYAVGLVGYALGLLGSALWDVPTGPAIVCALAAVAAIWGMLRAVAPQSNSPDRIPDNRHRRERPL